MSTNNLTINQLAGYGGSKLLQNKPLNINPGINLLVGRNGCGKSNLIELIRYITSGQNNIKSKIESSFFNHHLAKTRKKTDLAFAESFGSIPIVDFTFEGEGQTVMLTIDHNKDIPEVVVDNLTNERGKFQEYISITKLNFKKNWCLVHNDTGIKELDLSAYSTQNLIQKNINDNKITGLVEKPIDVVNRFVLEQQKKFYESPEFLSQLKSLENSINSVLYQFLGTTNKRIKITNKLSSYNSIELNLYDGKNRISPDLMSHGERVLLNLVFALKSAISNKYDFLVFDEPELHMHDDMIKVLVQELEHLENSIPNCTILIATHSTPLIEQLAILKKRPNLIVFDQDRNIFNSNSDIDLINALSRNGVSFSPLMLSNRDNIFIENQGADGFKYREHYLKFFIPEQQPNIIPIGAGGNVERSNSFTEIFSDILKVPDLDFVGIMDGDLWFKKPLVEYLKNNISLSEFIDRIPNESKLYIKGQHSYQLYFNFWEIENLYFFDELLACWSKGDEFLNTEKYKQILKENQAILIQEFSMTFIKSISKINFGKSKKMETATKKICDNYHNVQEFISESEQSNIHLKINKLYEKLLRLHLQRWLPGKEIKKLIENNGYQFNDSGFAYHTSKVGIKLQKYKL